MHIMNTVCAFCIIPLASEGLDEICNKQVLEALPNTALESIEQELLNRLPT